MAYYPARVTSGVLQGYSPLIGDYYDCAGTGTEADPWRPDSIETFQTACSNSGGTKHIKFADEIVSWEQEIAKAGDSSEIIAKKKKTIDMNRINPTDSVSYINTSFISSQGDINNFVNIDGNDTNIKNIYFGNSQDANQTRTNFISIRGVNLINLNIENAYINTSLSNGIINFNSCNMENCKISTVINAPNNVFFVRAGNRMPVFGNSFNIRYVQNFNSMNAIMTNYSGNYTPFTNCNFKFDLPAIARSENTLFQGNNMINCKIMLNLYRGNTSNSNYQIFLSRTNTGDIKNCVYMIKTIFDIPASRNPGFIGVTNYNHYQIASSGINLYNSEVINNGTYSVEDLANNRIGFGLTNSIKASKSQLVNKDWLIANQFPIMYEDNG